MVTKLSAFLVEIGKSSVLAKIHMVTKPILLSLFLIFCSVLAKIHMVTKPNVITSAPKLGSVLAKIHMVTKPSWLAL